MTAVHGSTRRVAAVVSRPLTIAGPEGELEAVVDSRRVDPDASNPGPAAATVTEAAAVAVVCHPHPLQEGTMHNKVVHTLARFFARRGVPAVRFNFRGVGRSAGEYAEGDGEVQDAVAAVDWARTRWPGAALYLAGFSFGGMVAIRVTASRPPAALLTVAPAIRSIDPSFEPPACPWLVVQGDADDVVAPVDVRAWAESLDPSPLLQSVPGVGHFFHGNLNRLADIAETFMREHVDPIDSTSTSEAG